jgi:hypothetical protein
MEATITASNNKRHGVVACVGIGASLFLLCSDWKGMDVLLMVASDLWKKNKENDKLGLLLAC